MADRKSIRRVLLMPDSLSLGSFSALCKIFEIPDFQNSTRDCNNFHQIPSKLYENIAYHGGMQAITLLGN